MQVDEFSDRILEDGNLRVVGDIASYCYGDDGGNRLIPIDGELLRLCDRLVAFAETVYSLSHGIRSADLEKAFQNLYKELQREEEVRSLVNQLHARVPA
jgi:putative hydrolase of HD superfamily